MFIQAESKSIRELKLKLTSNEKTVAASMYWQTLLNHDWPCFPVEIYRLCMIIAANQPYSDRQLIDDNEFVYREEKTE